MEEKMTTQLQQEEKVITQSTFKGATKLYP